MKPGPTIVSDVVFGADAPPRYVLLCGLDEWLLLGPLTAWPNNRALRFNWADIPRPARTPTPSRPAPRSCTVTASPPARAGACSKPGRERPQACPSASRDLKNALREAIDCSATRPPASSASGRRRKKGLFQRQGPARCRRPQPGILRLVYRLLFMFCIEARPSWATRPSAKSDIYLKGYSLESLRDLEMQPLTTPHAARVSLRRHLAPPLRWWPKAPPGACPPSTPCREAARSPAPAKPSLAPLDSRLFDDSTPAAPGQGPLPQPHPGRPSSASCRSRVARPGGRSAGSATSCSPSTSWARCMRRC